MDTTHTAPTAAAKTMSERIATRSWEYTIGADRVTFRVCATRDTSHVVHVSGIAGPAGWILINQRPCAAVAAQFLRDWNASTAACVSLNYTGRHFADL